MTQVEDKLLTDSHVTEGSETDDKLLSLTTVILEGICDYCTVTLQHFSVCVFSTPRFSYISL